MSLASARTEASYTVSETRHGEGPASRRVALKAWRKALRAHGRATCRKALRPLEGDFDNDAPGAWGTACRWK